MTAPDWIANVPASRSPITATFRNDAGSWKKPTGGYFVSFNALEGCATRAYELCKEGGVTLTKVGATFPYGKDPKDSNIRISPTFPPVEELKLAMQLFCICVKLATIEKLLASK